jgi:hypothetical protein
VSWREIVRADVQDERPRWVLSCYAHERERGNDVSGDISPEEVRWANMQAAKRGMHASQLNAEFKAAEQARVQLFNQLSRASKPPSLGGPALPLLSASISGLLDMSTPVGASLSGGPGFGQVARPAAGFGQQQQSATGFGQAAQPAAGFGQAAQPAAGFGQQPHPATGFGQTAQPAAGFGQAAQPGAGGFGGSFGALSSSSKPVFGQQKAATSFCGTPFGQQAGQSAFASTPFGQQAAAAAAPAAGSPFGSAAVAPSFGTFGQQPATAASAGSAAAQSLPPQQQAATAQDSADGTLDADVWAAAAFTKGKIPEHAPPPVFCR